MNIHFEQLLRHQMAERDYETIMVISIIGVIVIGFFLSGIKIIRPTQGLQ